MEGVALPRTHSLLEELRLEGRVPRRMVKWMARERERRIEKRTTERKKQRGTLRMMARRELGPELELRRNRTIPPPSTTH